MKKKELIMKLIEVPEKQNASFWAREYKFLKRLLEKFPDMSFWKHIEVTKAPSVVCHLNKKFLRYLEYKYSMHIPEYINPDLKTGEKKGKDKKIKKQVKTIKQFLKDE